MCQTNLGGGESDVSSIKYALQSQHLNFNLIHWKYLAHSCVVGCKERGGALPTVTVLTAQGMTIMHLFVVQVIFSTTHVNTQYSVNKQTNNILNLTPSGDRNYQLILASHRRCFLEENKSSFSLCFLFNHYFGWTIYCTHKKVNKKC